MDSPTTSARARGGILVKAIRTRELRGEGNNICDIFDGDNRGIGGDTTKLIKALRRRELRGNSKINIHGNLFERNRQKWIYQKDLKGHKGCVNAVEFSPDEEYIVSGGDDCNVQIWRTVNCCVESSPQPIAIMNTQHESNIFALRFSLHTERVYSGANDQQLLVHDIQTKALIRSFTADSCFYRISTHPANDAVIAAACEDHHVYIYDLRLDNNAVIKIDEQGPVFSVDYNQVQPNLMAVCSSPDGLQVYDLRRTKECFAQAGSFTKKAICAEWSPDGRAIFTIISRENPIYFNLENSEYIELKDPNYKNLCTVKSCTFAGSDYLVTGSDDWDIYVWKVPHKWDDKPIKEAFTVLKGHRSIVNHIRYSQRSDMLVSCGVEKIVKCWSATEMSASYKNPVRRARSCGIYINMLDSALEPDSTEEDLQVLSQFDHYYEQAVQSNRRDSSDDSENMMSLGIGSSDDDEEESIVSEISVCDDSPSEMDEISDDIGSEDTESDRNFLRSLLED